MGEYESNIDNILKNLDGKLKKIAKPKTMIREIATTLLGSITRRVHNDGQDVNNTPIGKYSTKLMLATKNQFKNKSKFKQSVIKSTEIVFSSNIKTRKTKAKKFKTIKQPLWIKFPKAKKAAPVMMIEGGYRDFRNIQGMDAMNVNLNYSGKLKADFGFAQLNNDYVLGFKSTYGSNLKKWQEEKWGKKIWGVTKHDQQVALQIFERYIQKTLDAQT